MVSSFQRKYGQPMVLFHLQPLDADVHLSFLLSHPQSLHIAQPYPECFCRPVFIPNCLCHQSNSYYDWGVITYRSSAIAQENNCIRNNFPLRLLQIVLNYVVGGSIWGLFSAGEVNSGEAELKTPETMTFFRSGVGGRNATLLPQKNIS